MNSIFEIAAKNSEVKIQDITFMHKKVLFLKKKLPAKNLRFMSVRKSRLNYTYESVKLFKLTFEQKVVFFIWYNLL